VKQAVVKRSLIAAAATLGIGLAAVAYIYVASALIIERRHPLPSSRIRASTRPDAVAQGAHLAVICGCTGCHGEVLQGARFESGSMKIYAPNLGLLAMTWSDADFDRAIRRSVAPDGRTLWIMPSHTYRFAADQDVADLIAYVRTLPHTGASTPAPKFALATRIKILRNRVPPEMRLAADNEPALDLGPRTAPGRRIAAMTCVECHGSDLSGTFLDPHWAPPDLAVVAAYSRADFALFMRTGTALGNRELRSMSTIARQRFAQLTDAEVSALYDYLLARGSYVDGNAQGHGGNAQRLDGNARGRLSGR
jgi:mono/diheme cytochrome c family protein